MTMHKQVRIDHEGMSADVDEDIAALVLALWRAGYSTTGSCESSPEAFGSSFIAFTSKEQADKFYEACDGAGLEPWAVDPVLDGVTEFAPEGTWVVAFTDDISVLTKRIGLAEKCPEPRCVAGFLDDDPEQPCPVCRGVGLISEPCCPESDCGPHPGGEQHDDDGRVPGMYRVPG